MNYSSSDHELSRRQSKQEWLRMIKFKVKTIVDILNFSIIFMTDILEFAFNQWKIMKKKRKNQ